MRSNAFNLKMRSLTGKFPDSPSVSFTVDELSKDIPLEKDQSVVLRAERDPNVKQIKFTAEIT